MRRLPITTGMSGKIMLERGILVLLAMCLWGMPRAFAEEGRESALAYSTGSDAMVELGIALQQNLPPEYRSQVNARPVKITPDVIPIVRLEEVVNPNTSQRMACVHVSSGFVDLVNNVAHAKAIDRIEKGYFKNYILILSREHGNRPLQPLPRISDPRFWTDRMMNEQQSNFNQIVGGVIGSKLALYYLGYYQKHCGQLSASNGKHLPINTVLTLEDWDDALNHGINNALSCGYGVEGIQTLFECIGKMPERPAWTLYFLPAAVNVAKANKEMEKLERKFFGHR
jgi:hypothetical protein